jgi:chromate transporter
VKLLVIFAEFCKIGLFAVGGGLATLPFLFELAEKYEWLRPEQIRDFLAIAQSSPGSFLPPPVLTPGKLFSTTLPPEYGTN